MARYTALFLAEAEDHLQQGEELVHHLEMNRTCRETLNGLFRHLHSLKGMAATMGFADMARISHAMEDLLDRSRQDRRNGGVPAEDLLLVANGFGYIRAIIRAVGDDRPRDNQDAATLSDLIRNRLEQPITQEQEPHAVAPIEADSRNESEPKSTWRIELRLDEDCAGSTGKVVGLVNRLGSLGIVRHILPPLPSGRTGCGERIVLELSTPGSREELEQALRNLQTVHSFSIRPIEAGTKQERSSARSARFVRVRSDLLDILMENALELTLAHENLSGRIGTDGNPGVLRGFQRCRQLVENQYATLTELRLVPFETVANRIRAGVDSLVSRHGKKIRFCMEGRLVRLDRSLLESLVDPLLHIMRNAIDHGIEPSTERTAAGKPAEGTISLRLTREGNAVRFSIEDDGRGMLADDLRARAVAMNFMTRDQADRLSDRECHFLVTIPGFSTVSRVGDVSGRGVGMDVVRNEVESLGGRLEISSRPGAGTLFALEVPQSMAIIQALLVRYRRELFAVPVMAISRTLDLRNVDLVRKDKRIYLERGQGFQPLSAVTVDGSCGGAVPSSGGILLA